MEYKTLSKNSFLVACPITSIFKSILFSYALSAILFLIFSFLITYTKVPYSIITPVSIIITLLSILTASIANGRKSSEKGWLTGCITGFLYMIILYIIGSIIFKNPAISGNGIVMIIAGIFAGTLGSIIGINNKKHIKKERKFLP